MIDFVATNYGTVWGLRAVTNVAKEFAAENFKVDGWMGSPTNFKTDWRAGRDLADQLAGEGWNVEMSGVG
jgi:hypothetical protein